MVEFGRLRNLENGTRRQVVDSTLKFGSDVKALSRLFAAVAFAAVGLRVPMQRGDIVTDDGCDFYDGDDVYVHPSARNERPVIEEDDFMY